MAADPVTSAVNGVNSNQGTQTSTQQPISEKDFAELKQPLKDKQSSAVSSLEALTPAEKEKRAKEGKLPLGTMSEKSVKEMTKGANEFLKSMNVNLELTYDRDVDMINVKVIDKKTKEVLREYPPEEMLENMKRAKEWLGAFIDRAV